MAKDKLGTSFDEVLQRVMSNKDAGGIVEYSTEDEKRRIEAAANAVELEKAKEKEAEDKRQDYFAKTCDPKYMAKSWSEYHIRGDNEKSIARVKKWLENGCVDDNGKLKWLIIYGNQGTGKTFLKNLIIKDLYDKHKIRVKSLTMYNLYMQYLDALNSGKLTKLFNEINQEKILIIDELGRKKLTQAIYDFLFEIVDTIYLENKCLVIVSNLPPVAEDGKEGIADYLDNERLRESGIPIKLTGDSFRK